MALERFRTAVLAAVFVLGAAAGCATDGASKTGDKKYTTVCNEDAPTGSHISRLKCYRRRDVDERGQRDRAGMEKRQYNTARPAQADQPLVMQGSRSSVTASRARFQPTH